jgi:hypothetical protein
MQGAFIQSDKSNCSPTKRSRSLPDQKKQASNWHELGMRGRGNALRCSVYARNSAGKRAFPGLAGMGR